MMTDDPHYAVGPGHDSNTVAKVETEYTLPDIRAGDIMLCPDGVERMVVLVWSCESPWVGFRSRPEDIESYECPIPDVRNPEFRVGDKVRHRNPGGPICPGVWNADLTPERWALVERADKKAADKKDADNRRWAEQDLENLARKYSLPPEVELELIATRLALLRGLA